MNITCIFWHCYLFQRIHLKQEKCIKIENRIMDVILRNPTNYVGFLYENYLTSHFLRFGHF